MEIGDKTTKKQLPKELEEHKWKPGESGNPNGRPKGISIKDRVRIWLEEHPDDMQSFVQHFVKENRDLAWQMMEGRPSQSTDLTSGGEKIEFNVNMTEAGNDNKPNTETISSDEGQPQI
jgi:hypothetical protein